MRANSLISKIALHIPPLALPLAGVLWLFSYPMSKDNIVFAPGDAGEISLPSYLAPFELWTGALFSGFPIAAEPQAATFYLPAIVGRLVNLDWDVYYALALAGLAWSTYAFAYTLSKDRFGATLSAVLFALGGYTNAHLTHHNIIQSLVWMPLLLLALHKLSERPSGVWFAVGAAAVALALTAGHPQYFVYALLLAGAYSLFRFFETGRVLPFVFLAPGVVAVGIGLASVQVFFTLEIIPNSARVAYGFEQFVGRAVPLLKLVTAFYPFILGDGYATTFSQVGALTGWSQAEMQFGVGFTAIMLAALACVAARRYFGAQVVFWGLVAAFGIIAAIGEVTPLPRLLYELPVYGKFRVNARHLMFDSFALSILAGLGLASLRKNRFSRTAVLAVVSCGLAVMIAIPIAIYASRARFIESARVSAEAFDRLFAWGVIPPLVLAVVTAAILLFVSMHRWRAVLGVLLVFCIAAEILLTSRYRPWDPVSGSSGGVTVQRGDWTLYAPPPDFMQLAGDHRDLHQRVMTLDGNRGRLIYPHMTRVWALETGTGQSPLVLSPYQKLLGMSPPGDIDLDMLRRTNRAHDLLAFRYMLFDAASYVRPQTTTEIEPGLAIVLPPNFQTVGRGCEHPASGEELSLPLRGNGNVDRVLLIGHLDCGINLEDGEPTVRLELLQGEQRIRQLGVEAGHDLSEAKLGWADLAPRIRHSKAVVFREYEHPRGPHYDFVVDWKLEDPVAADGLRLTGLAREGSIIVKAVVAVRSDGEVENLLDPRDALRDTGRWSRVGIVEPVRPRSGKKEIVVFENLNALPRVWLVAEQEVMANEDDMLRAISAGHLEDGRSYDPRQIALTETELGLTVGVPLADEEFSRVKSRSSDHLEVAVNTLADLLLVSSDIFYPGWEVEVDGKPASIHRVNGLLRGVVVPKGSVAVRFDYRPVPLKQGLWVAAASALVLVLGLLGWRQPARWAKAIWPLGGGSGPASPPR